MTAAEECMRVVMYSAAAMSFAERRPQPFSEVGSSILASARSHCSSVRLLMAMKAALMRRSRSARCSVRRDVRRERLQQVVQLGDDALV